MSWPIVKLGEIFEIARGGSPRPIDDYFTDEEDGLNWVSIKDASDSEKYIYSTQKKIKPSGLVKTREVKPGDFLLTNSMSFGRPYIMKTHGCIHDGWLLLRGNPKQIDQDYFYHLLGSDLIFKKFSSLAAGAVVKNLNSDLVRNVEVSLPPLEEQKRIAAILDKADAIRRKRQQAIKLADDFLRSVFLEMFGDPVTNPKGWEVKKLGAVSDSQLGKMLSAKSKVGNAPKKYLRNANVRWREFDLDDVLEMDFDEREMKKFSLHKGDLLVCEGGEIGRCAIWREELNDCYFQKALHRIRVSQDIFTSEYVQEYFYWMSVNGGLAKSSSEVTFSHLTAEKLKELDIPVPSIALQKEFSSIYRKLNELKTKNKKIDYVNENLFSSLSQKAFSGK